MPARPPRLLRTIVIEDDDALRRAFLEALTARGHVTIGLNRFDRPGAADIPRADVWIVDHTLPGRLGTEIVRLLRSPASRSRTALVLAVSADPRVERDFLAAGADRFIAKPYGLHALLDAIDATTAEAAVGAG